MPSTSKKQHKFMEAIAHNKAFAKKVGIPQTVGQDFSNADKGKHFSRGGDMRSMKFREGSPAEEKTESKRFEKKEDMGMAKGGMHHHHMQMAHHHLKEAMKHGGHVKKMASGGMTTGVHGDDEKKGLTTAKMARVKEGGNKAHGEHKVQERGHTRAMEPKMKGNTIGNGPLVNVKGPAMKRGGKTHHKK